MRMRMGVRVWVRMRVRARTRTRLSLLPWPRSRSRTHRRPILRLIREPHHRLPLLSLPLLSLLLLWLSLSLRPSLLLRFAQPRLRSHTRTTRCQNRRLLYTRARSLRRAHMLLLLPRTYAGDVMWTSHPRHRYTRRLWMRMRVSMLLP